MEENLQAMQELLQRRHSRPAQGLEATNVEAESLSMAATVVSL
jgi:hypothetical protein